MTDALGPVIRVAPAKINLTLAVTGRRPDGFHDLHSVFVPLSLADHLSLAVGAPGGKDSLHVAGHDTGPRDQDLVLRAIAAARAAVGAGPGRPATAPIAARLEKHIPVGAGLGGGSSDAAATLDGALEAWDAELTPSARLAVAAALGSDVPFFLAGGPALVEGRGEHVTRLTGLRADPEPPAVLLVTPAVHVATGDVFAVFAGSAARGDGSVRMTSAHLAEELRTGLAPRDLVARAAVLAAANDLLGATALVVPALVPFRRALARLLGRPIGMSGSGPTLWALYATISEATAAAAQVRDALAGGALETPGDGPPLVAASAILTGHPTPPGREP